MQHARHGNLPRHAEEILIHTNCALLWSAYLRKYCYAAHSSTGCPQPPQHRRRRICTHDAQLHKQRPLEEVPATFSVDASRTSGGLLEGARREPRTVGALTYSRYAARMSVRKLGWRR